jgi:endonuclease G
MLRIILTTLFLYTTSLWANPIDDKCPQFVVRGAPVSSIHANDQYLCRMNYAVHYRYDTKTAEYVVEHVTKESVSGKAKRKDNFHPDSEIPKEHAAQLSDYDKTYDRGHLAPAGDNTQNDEIMSQSFLLSNMVPQVPNNNRGIWKQLETFVREWVLENNMDLYVVSGTIYSNSSKTIGANKVGVPDKLFKVIVDKKTGHAIAFIFPNAALPVGDLPKYATSIETVEKATGINFMPLLPDNLKKIKSTAPDLKQWPDLELLK